MHEYYHGIRIHRAKEQTNKTTTYASRSYKSKPNDDMVTTIAIPT